MNMNKYLESVDTVCGECTVMYDDGKTEEICDTCPVRIMVSRLNVPEKIGLDNGYDD